MEELSLSVGFIRLLEIKAQTLGFDRVKTVWLEIGSLAGIEESALRYSFSSISRGTIADSARLEITRIPARAKCNTCQHHTQLNTRHDPCPLCGVAPMEILEGERVTLKKLEVE